MRYTLSLNGAFSPALILALISAVFAACSSPPAPASTPTAQIIWTTPTSTATPIIIVVTATPTATPIPTPPTTPTPVPDTPTPTSTARAIPRPQPTLTPLPTAFPTGTPRPADSYTQILATLTPTPTIEIPTPSPTPLINFAAAARGDYNRTPQPGTYVTVTPPGTPVPTPTLMPTIAIPPSPTVPSPIPTVAVPTRPTPIPTLATTTATSKGFTPTPASTQSVMYPDDTPLHAMKIEEQIATVTNKQREDRGLQALVVDLEIGAIARAHSYTMVERKRFSHSAGGTTPTERALAAGYTCKAWKGGSYSYGLSENISRSPRVTSWTILGGTLKNPRSWRTDPRAMAEYIVEWWMNSPGHRENILDPDIRRIGVGVAIDLRLERSGRLRPGQEHWASEMVYATQNFSKCSEAEVEAVKKGT